ncbi:MAG: hypothetical protein AAGC55_05195 [Myxococcota bacterium]
MSENEHKDTTTSDARSADSAGGSAGFDWDPTLPFRIGMDIWTRISREQIDRLQSMCDELAEAESEAYQRLRKSSREMSSLMDQSMEYATQLSAEWRKIVLEATRKSAEFVSRI